MSKKYLAVLGMVAVGIIASMLFVFPMNGEKEKTVSGSGKPTVSVSTFALYEVARSISGDSMNVHPVIPLGTDAHMFSPNPKQVAEISKSALFIYNGAGFEPWMDSLKHSLPSTIRIVDMSGSVSLLSQEEEHDHEEHHGHDHGEGTYDPHYWLDIDNMIKMTRKTEEELVRIVPENSAMLHRNAQAYIAELEALKRDYTEGLSECKNRVLVSNHNAFGYLAHANRLEDVSVIGLSSDEQPSAKNIADIIALVKEHGIKTVFFEEFINDNIAQTIARETGASAKSLQPLENISEDELESHQTYLTIMRDNLAKLREAMECH